MDEKAVLHRKILLQGQALRLIRDERKELKRRLFLLELREDLASQIGTEFDRTLSSKLDAVNALLA